MAFSTREGKTQTALAEINMVPFIDIVLVLLIIFMITAPVIQSGLDISVPKTRVVRELTEQKLVVTVDKEEKLFLQTEAININDLAPKIREKLLDPTRQSIYLQADEKVSWGTMATVMDYLKGGGIENVVVVTQPIGKTTP